MRARLSMKMQMRTTPQLVLAGELLRVSGADLESRIHQEIRDNPALELHRDKIYLQNLQSTAISSRAGTSFSKEYSYTGYSSEPPTFEDRLEKMAQQQPVIDQLIEQAAMLVSKRDLETVTALLYAVDSDGYLRCSSKDLSVQLGLDQQEIERLIPILHELEPPGIGARDLRECLLIQCRYLLTNGTHCELVKRIIEGSWDDFIAQRWDRVAKRLGVARTELEEACQFISRNFHPHPLALMAHEGDHINELNQPDLVISCPTGKNIFSLEIPAAAAFELRLSYELTHVPEQPGFEDLSLQEKMWIRNQVERARLFILSLQKRWETLRRIGEYVIDFQGDFLNYGPGHLKPLTQAMVARALNCHESTVSRAVQNKVVQLPNGRLIMMDVFFDATIPVKAAIKKIMAESRKSVSDREMSERLAAIGYSVARRTISKYRAQLTRASLH